MILYHGSENIIDKPEFGKGKFYNDYGRGCYCTENIELAKEWACTDNYIGYVNTYGIDLDRLNVLYLTSDDYSMLNWLAVLIFNRGLRITTRNAKRAVKWLKDNYYIDVESYDVVVGYRADDSYFAFARAFLNNEISYKQLCYAIRLGKLGEQVVIKSREGFEQIKYIEANKVKGEYLIKRKQRDEMARKLYMEEMEREDIDGMYIIDMMRVGDK
jgi:hypothetical protein